MSIDDKRETQSEQPINSSTSAEKQSSDSPLIDVAIEVNEAITDTVSQTSKNLAETVAGVSKVIEDVAKTAATVSETVGGAASETTQLAAQLREAAQQLLEQATAGTGQTLAAIAENPLLKFIIKLPGADWFLTIVGQVDEKQALSGVRELQSKYPKETPSQIAHRLMVEKSLYAGGIGLVTNIIPPIAVAFIGIDLVATTKLQAEMIYQIAAAYGLDLQDPARRGEVLGIFGLSLGSSGVLKTGLSVVEILPGVGAMVGASSNAIMLYALGYVARHFYEAKTNPQTQPVTAAVLQQESEDYLKAMVAQRVIMDQILVQMILTSCPEKSWSDIVPELQQLALPSSSVDRIAANLQSPQPLEALLEQLHPDLAPSLLARCYKIAQLDSMITPAETEVLVAIAQKFNLELSTIEDALNSQQK
ncbi:hypothetical protein [Lyngbya aestuarii]|uniref:hypothetical protein n=1 Tax=Lyngbya aestuarii TaxID=118322 RepID=UPI00403E2067